MHRIDTPTAQKDKFGQGKTDLRMVIPPRAAAQRISTVICGMQSGRGLYCY